MKKRHFLKLLAASPLLAFIKPKPKTYSTTTAAAIRLWEHTPGDKVEITMVVSGREVGIIEVNKAILKHMEEIDAMAKERKGLTS